MKTTLLAIAATTLLSGSASADNLFNGSEVEPARSGFTFSLPADFVENLLAPVRFSPRDGHSARLSWDVAESPAHAAPAAAVSTSGPWLLGHEAPDVSVQEGRQLGPRNPRRATVVIEGIPGPVLLIASTELEGTPREPR